MAAADSRQFLVVTKDEGGQATWELVPGIQVAAYLAQVTNGAHFTIEGVYELDQENEPSAPRRVPYDFVRVIGDRYMLHMYLSDGGEFVSPITITDW